MKNKCYKTKVALVSVCGKYIHNGNLSGIAQVATCWFDWKQYSN